MPSRTDPPPIDEPVLAYGRCVYEDGEEDMYVAVIRYSPEDRCWYMDGTRNVFYPVKWSPL